MSSTDTDTNTDDDTSCPPGMSFDADAGKCVEGKSSERHSKEDTNAGTSTDAGTTTVKDADPQTMSGTDHECPEGTTWNTDKGTCEPTGDDAGKAGGAGTGAPEVPGKEIYKMMEKMQSAHTAYNQKILEKFQESHQKQLEAMMKGMGKPVVSNESAAFGKFKGESVSRSSAIDTAGFDSIYAECVQKPATFFEEAKKWGATKSNDQGTGFISWIVNPTAYLETLHKGYMNYSHPNNAHAPSPKTSDPKLEAFTITAGDMPQVFSKLVYLIPGGRMKVPIRQFLDTQIIETADRFNWYKVNGFDFDDTTSEGTEPTNESQTITKVQATPTIVRAVQTVNYSDIENAPFDLIEAFNRAVALGAIDAEAKEVLDTTYNALASTPNTNDTFQWIRGNDGVAIITDDDASMGDLQQEGIYAAMRALQNKGGDTSPGNVVGFFFPESIEQLILDTANDFFTQGGSPAGAPLHSTALGILENRLGLDIVVTNRVATVDNATNDDTARNIICLKGSLGLAVAADLQIEAQRRPDLSAIKIGARHRLKGAIIDESMTVRVSSSIDEIV